MSSPADSPPSISSASWKWHLRVVIAVFCNAVYWIGGASVFLLLAWTVVWFLPKQRSREFGQRLLHRGFAGFAWLLKACGIIRITFSGFEKWNPELRGQVIAPNHPALWDALLIMGRISGLTCVLKSSLLHNPLLSGGARLAQFIPGSPPLNMVRLGVRAVREGQNLLIFPESTRTLRPQCALNEIKGGIGMIADRTEAPVWPLVVRTDSLYLSKGWPIWRWPRQPVNIEFLLLDPIQVEQGETAQEFVARLRAVYLSVLSASPDDLARPDSQLQHRSGPAGPHGD
ncbi:MAG: lysophospholipid acyltransferase family protein [Prosthecobacter sp.]